MSSFLCFRWSCTTARHNFHWFEKYLSVKSGVFYAWLIFEQININLFSTSSFDIWRWVHWPFKIQVKLSFLTVFNLSTGMPTSITNVNHWTRLYLWSLKWGVGESNVFNFGVYGEIIFCKFLLFYNISLFALLSWFYQNWIGVAYIKVL